MSDKNYNFRYDVLKKRCLMYKKDRNQFRSEMLYYRGCFEKTDKALKEAEKEIRRLRDEIVQLHYLLYVKVEEMNEDDR